MVDPITAVATATAAFNTIKSAFAAGRDIEGMAGDLSRWMGAVSDIKKAEEYSKKPPLFKKLFASGSSERAPCGNETRCSHAIYKRDPTRRNNSAYVLVC